MFRLWAQLLKGWLKRFHDCTAVQWIANAIAALAFSAAHLVPLMHQIGATSIDAANPLLLVEIILLNGAIGLAAGEWYMKDGLVAAAGVHFWTDVVFHVLYGLTAV